MSMLWNTILYMNNQNDHNYTGPVYNLHNAQQSICRHRQVDEEIKQNKITILMNFY